MPDFRVKLTDADEGGAIATEPFVDAPGELPSRIAMVGGRQPRHYVCRPGTTVRFTAYLNGDSFSRSDAVAGTFACWAVEWASEFRPEPTNAPGSTWSSIAQVTLDQVGHYVFAMRHLVSPTMDGGDGGVVLIHLDVQGASDDAEQ